MSYEYFRIIKVNQIRILKIQVNCYYTYVNYDIL